MKSYIDTMIRDTSLDNEDKIELLKSFSSQINYKIESEITHSSKLLEYSEVLKFIEQNIKRLNETP